MIQYWLSFACAMAHLCLALVVLLLFAVAALDRHSLEHLCRQLARLLDPGDIDAIHGL
jgi:cobalamin biosynthesis protein CobD/CbiB